MNEMFWVSNYILQPFNKVLKFSCDICTHGLENVTIVSKNVPKQLRKPVKTINISKYFFQKMNLFFQSIITQWTTKYKTQLSI